MEQLIAHLIGDYLLQSDWMALGKRKSFGVATIHALAYGLPFLFLHCSANAWLFIVVTHALIDHLAIARYVVFAKNFLAPPSEWPKWANTNATGYDKQKAVWMSTWLFILADNTLHLCANYAALRWF